MTATTSLTPRRIAAFWTPLAATWLMMAAEGPLLAAIIARGPEPRYNLAAYGVAYALALLVEAPVIMMMSAATALAVDRTSYLRLRRFTHLLNLGVTLAMGVLLLPPVFDLVAGGLIGLAPEVARRTWVAVAILLPWPGTIGYRRFWQGVLIHHGQTRRVAYGTVVRLMAMATTALVTAGGGLLHGAAVGAAALSAGVTVEAAAAWWMARGAVRRVLASEAAAAAPSMAEIGRFYWPLAATSLLSLGIQPVVTFFVGHGRAPLESLAVLPVINGLVFVFRSLGLAFQEVVIALDGDDHAGRPALLRFGLWLGGGVVAALTAIAWTPLAHLWFQTVSGLQAELADFALVPTRIMAVLPGLTVLLSVQRALAVIHRRTALVTRATGIEVTTVVAVLAVAVHWLDAPGAIAAAAALLLGRLAANGFLARALARAGTREAAP